MKKKIAVIVSVCLTLLLGISATIYSKDLAMGKFVLESKILPAEDLYNKLVRFHVIANSDEDVDQAVKMKVKDQVLKAMTPKLQESESQEETVDIINENKVHIRSIAKDTLEYYGIDDDVNVELNTTYFPTKYYEDFSLPAGEYLSLRVIIGSGEGQNWWCVLFPPLCLVDVKTEPIEEQDNEKEENIDISVDEKSETEEETSSSDSEDIDKQDIHRESVSEEEAYVDENIDIQDKIFEAEDEEVQSDKVQVRWKALEIFGYYD